MRTSPTFHRVFPALLAAACLLPGIARATTVQGAIGSDTTWNADGNPYIVTGDIRVDNGVVLTIGPGVELQVSTSDAANLGSVTTRVELLVDGTLAINGTAAAPVRIRSANSGAGPAAWEVIAVRSGGTATVDHAVVQQASYGLRVLSGGQATVRNSELFSHSVCVWNDASTLTVEDSTLRNCSTGLSASDGVTAVARTTIRDNTNGVIVSNSVNNPAMSASFSHSVFARNQYTVNAHRRNVAAAISFRRNIFWQGRLYQDPSGFAVDSDNNLMFQHSISSWQVGPGDRAENPLFVDVAANDFRITANSWARRPELAGQPAWGRFRYDGTPTVGLVGHLYADVTIPSGTSAPVRGDVTVEPGVTLTLEAGSALRFDVSDLMGSGIDTTRAELIVEGALAATGTATQRITLRSSTANGAPAEWYGVRLLSGASATYRYLDVADTQQAIRLEGAATTTLDLVTFRRCNQYAVMALDGANATVTNSQFSENSCGLFLNDGQHVVRGNIFNRVSGNAVYMSTQDATAAAEVRHNTIYGRAATAHGIRFSRTSPLSVIDVRDNNIFRTTNGIYVDSGGQAIPVYNNNVWAVGASPYFNVMADFSNLVMNPLLEDPEAGLFAPTSNSPLIGAASGGGDIGAVPFAGAQTRGTLMGVVRTNLTLNGSAGDVFIGGDVIIPAGVTLTIEPGTTVRLGTGDGMAAGADPNRTEIIVYGTLNAGGLPDGKILFRSGNTQAPAADDWFGIRLMAGSSSHTVTHLDIDHARYGIIGQLDSALAISNNRTHVNDIHYQLSGTGPFNISNNTMVQGNYGIILDDNNQDGVADGSLISATVTRNIAYQMVHWALIAYSNQPEVDYLIDHNTFWRTRGILARRYVRDTRFLISNNIVGGGVYGLYSDSTTYKPDHTHNDLWGTSAALINWGTLGTNISGNPLFIDETTLDFRVSPESPVIGTDTTGGTIGAVEHVGDEPSAGMIGTLRGETRLTARPEPYILRGDIVVPAGASLIIEPGAVLQVEPTDAMRANRDPNRIEIVVHGTLSVGGPDAQTVITATAPNNTTNEWWGISMRPGSTLTRFENVHLRHARSGLEIMAQGTFAVRNVTMDTVHRCLNVVGQESGTTNVTVEDSSFSGVGEHCLLLNHTLEGARPAGGERLIFNVRRNLIHSVGSYAMVLHNIDADDQITVRHNTIDQTTHSSMWVGVVQATNAVEISNNTTSRYSGYGVYLDTAIIPRINHNNFWRGSAGDSLSNRAVPSTNFSMNPLFVDWDAARDYRPTHRSPLRQAGDDGADLGRFAFNGALTDGLVGVVHEDETLTSDRAWLLEGDLIVRPGRTLTIQPGTQVRVANTTDRLRANRDPTRAELIVRGTLSIGGPGPRTSISAVPPGEATNSWYGIIMLPGSSLTRFENLTLRHARQGLEVGAQGNFALRDVTMDQVNRCVASVGENAGTTDVLIENSTFSNTADYCLMLNENLLGVTPPGGERMVMRIRNNLLYNIGSYGAILRNIDADDQVQVRHNTLDSTTHSSLWVELVAPNTSVEITNNVGSRYTGYGVYSNSAIMPRVEFNNFWRGSGASSLSNYVLSPTNVSMNPLYVDPDTARDYRPTHRSPLRMAGDDGTDVGRFGYQGQLTQGLLGVVNEDETLTNDREWVLEGDLMVRNGRTLTIQPGTTILVTAGSDRMRANSNVNTVQVLVSGVLNAQGTAARPVLFRSNNRTNPTNSDWDMLRLEPSAPRQTWSDIVVRHASNGVQVANSAGAVLNHLTVGNTQTVAMLVEASAGPTEITRSRLEGGVNNGLILRNGQARVASNVIYNYTLTGLTADIQATLQDVTLLNNTVAHNRNGITVNRPVSGELRLVNNLITNHTAAAITFTGREPTLFSNNVFSNVGAPYAGFTSHDSSNTAVDPQYVDATNRDYRLSATSPLIDVGNGMFLRQEDRDLVGRPRVLPGSSGATPRVDLGALEYDVGSLLVTDVDPARITQGLTGATVRLVGQGFTAATTAAVSGTGVTVTGTNLVDANNLELTVTVAANAPPSIRDLTVTDNGLESTTFGAITVVSQPLVTSVTPNQVRQQSVQTVTVTGSQFMPGANAVLTGGGVLLSQPSVGGNGTSLVFSLTVSSLADPGARSLRIVNPDGGEIVVTDAITIIRREPLPVITSMAPTAIAQGSQVVFTVTGEYFQDGAVASVSGLDITVTQTQFVDAQTLMVDLLASVDADLLPRDITITNPDGGMDTLPLALDVVGELGLTSVNPDHVRPGMRQVAMQVTGVGFTRNASWRFIGPGADDTSIQDTSSTYFSSTSYQVYVDVADTAPLGGYTLEITSEDGVIRTLENAVTVDPLDAPAITSIVPAAIPRGATGVAVAINGSNFNTPFTLTVGGAGVTVDSAQLISSTRINAVVSVDGGTDVGPRDVFLDVQRGGSTRANGGLTVLDSVSITRVEPTELPAGATSARVTLEGINLRADYTYAFSGTGVTVLAAQPETGGRVSLTVNVAAAAALGARTLTARSGSLQVAQATDAVQIVGPVSVTAVVPGALLQGVSAQALRVEGAGFLPGTTFRIAGGGVTITGAARPDDRTLNGTAAVALGAQPGTRDVEVVLPGGYVHTAPGMFTVTAGPAVTSLSPDRVPRGAVAQEVTVRGTSFRSDLTWEFVGSGITNLSAEFVSSTTVVLTLDVEFGARSGPRDLKVTRADGVELTVTEAIFLYNADDPTDPNHPVNNPDGGVATDGGTPGGGADGGSTTLCPPGQVGLVACPVELFFLAEEGGAATATQDINVRVPGRTGVPYSAVASEPWIVLGAAGGTAPGALTVAVDPQALLIANSPYRATVTLSSSGLPDRVVDVTAEVVSDASQTPALQIIPSSLSLRVTRGQPMAPVAINVSSRDGRQAAYTTLLEPTGFMTVTPSSGSLPATLMLNGPVETLAARDAPYIYTLTVIAPSLQESPKQSIIRIQVVEPLPPGTIASSPSQVVLSATEGATAPVTNSVDVISVGGADIAYTASVTSMTPWLTITNGTSGNTPANLELAVDPSTLTNAGSPFTGTITLTSTDGSGSTVDVPVTVVVGQPLPVANAGANQRRAPSVVYLDGSASSAPGGGALTYAWKQISGPETVVLRDADAATPHFAAMAAGAYVFELTVSDSNSIPSEPSLITVTIRDVPPTAHAGTDLNFALETPGRVLTLDGRQSADGNGETVQHLWRQVSGPEVMLSDDEALQPTFLAEQPGRYVFELTVVDPSGDVGRDEVAYTVQTAADTIPSADARAVDRVLTSQPIQLDGTRSSHGGDGAELTYAWTQVSGPVGLLASNDQATATFTSPNPGLAVFELVVSDGTHTSAPARVSVAIDAPNNQVPTAVIAGGNLVEMTLGERILVDARMSTNGQEDPQGTLLSFHIAQEEGPETELAATADEGVWAFGPVLAGTYKLRVRVADQNGLSRGQVIWVAVHEENHVPLSTGATADMGLVGDTLRLHAADTMDVDGETLTYAWQQLSGPVVAMDDPNGREPQYLARVQGDYRFAVRLRDGTFLGPPQEVSWTVGADPNRTPVANAGMDLQAVVDTVVTLDGTASMDPDGQPLTYTWRELATPGAFHVEIDTADQAQASFVPPAAGVYRFGLVVSDGRLSSVEDEVVVTVRPSVSTTVNSAPVAYAGDDVRATVDQPVTLDGSNSYDPDGDTLTFQWTLVDGPAVVTVENADTAQPTFTPTRQGIYVLELKVRDGRLTSLADQVRVTAWRNDMNLAPTADAGEALTVRVGEPFTLDGSNSSDPDGDPLVHTWEQVVGPVILDGLVADAVTNTLTARVPGFYQFQLVVDDGLLESTPDTVVVEVLPAANTGGDGGVNPGTDGGDIITSDGGIIVEAPDGGGVVQQPKEPATTIPGGCGCTVSEEPMDDTSGPLLTGALLAAWIALARQRRRR